MNDLTYLRQRFGKRWKSSYELLLLPNEYEIAIDNFFEKFPTIIHDFVNCQLSPGRNHQPGARLPIGYGKILWMWNLLKKARRIGQVHEIDVSPQGILITDALLPQEMEEYKSIMNSLLKKRGGGQAGTHYNDSSAVRDAFSKLLEYIEGRCTCIQAFLHANADAALMADIGGQYIVEQTNLYFYFANRFVEMFFGGVHQLKCGETTVDSCTAIEVSADITKKFETNDARRKKNKPHDEEQNEAEESKSREASDGMGGASLQQVPSVPVPSVDQTPQPTTSPPATADTTTTTMNPFVANYGLA